MKIVTWNVNSIRSRVQHVVRFLKKHQPDIIGLQELKCLESDFPWREIQELGYGCYVSGQKTYNGVAFLCKDDAQVISKEIPGFPDESKRVLVVKFHDYKMINIYLPNGSEVGSEKYEYKLAWCEAFLAWIKKEFTSKTIILGDFNIAPFDIDVYNPQLWHERVLCSTKERKYLHELFQLGFQDAFRKLHPATTAYSWWDYRTFGFQKNEGLRIDLILTSEDLASKISAAEIFTEERAAEKPSDHSPVGIVI